MFPTIVDENTPEPTFTDEVLVVWYDFKDLVRNLSNDQWKVILFFFVVLLLLMPSRRVK